VPLNVGKLTLGCCCFYAILVASANLADDMVGLDIIPVYCMYTVHGTFRASIEMTEVYAYAEKPIYVDALA
jgi:hypothetical protein